MINIKIMVRSKSSLDNTSYIIKDVMLKEMIE